MGTDSSEAWHFAELRNSSNKVDNMYADEMYAKAKGKNSKSNHKSL